MAFNSAAIVKPKKFKGTEKVKSSHLQGVEELMPKEADELNEATESYKKGSKFETSDAVKQTALNSINPIKPGNLMGTNKPKEEELLSIDIMLNNAKKSKEAPKDENAFDKEAGYFKVEKDKEGMFKESGESAKKRYMDKIKSRKGM